jgi:transcriptional regulator with XRE-family HTH domain
VAVRRDSELRDKAGLSLRKLADQIGISSPFLSDIERIRSANRISDQLR